MTINIHFPFWRTIRRVKCPLSNYIIRSSRIKKLRREGWRMGCYCSCDTNTRLNSTTSPSGLSRLTVAVTSSYEGCICTTWPVLCCDASAPALDAPGLKGTKRSATLPLASQAEVDSISVLNTQATTNHCTWWTHSSPFTNSRADLSPVVDVLPLPAGTPALTVTSESGMES